MKLIVTASRFWHINKLFRAVGTLREVQGKT